MESLRGNEKFFDYCCRDYSVWKNTQTGETSVFLIRTGTPGVGWRFEKGDLCCEEAEELAGKPGACSGTKGGNTNWGATNNNAGLNGTNLTYYRGTTAEKCQADCDANPKCKAFTLIRAGAYNANDPPMCYLMSEATGFAPSSCCISAVKNESKSGNNNSSAEIDLSGTWSAVVNSAEGKWGYTMILKRESAGKWTGTLTTTLDGKSPDTTAAAVESVGSGKMNWIWRPGKPNAQSFEGTYTKDKISVTGFGGQILFTRR